MHTVIQFIFVISTIPLSAQAKFERLYPGIVQDGLEACLKDPKYNLTISTIKRRDNCHLAFTCIMNNIDNSRQTILAAGTSALSFIPTALALLGNRRSEIMAIHWHFPILALLLTLTGISTAGDRLGWIFSSRVKSDQTHRETSKNRFGVMRVDISRRERLGFAAFHIIAAFAAAGIIWQTYDLAQKAVFSWACWTSVYPLTWPFLGVVQYLLDVAVSHLTRARPRHANAFKAFSDTFGILTYLYATIVLSSLTLVSGANAIKIIAVYGLVAGFMRILTAGAIDVIGSSSTRTKTPTSQEQHSSRVTSGVNSSSTGAILERRHSTRN